MVLKKVLYVLRGGWASDEEIQTAMKEGANMLEKLNEANKDWTKYAEEHGIDIVPAYHFIEQKEGECEHDWVNKEGDFRGEFRPFLECSKCNQISLSGL